MHDDRPRGAPASALRPRRRPAPHDHDRRARATARRCAGGSADGQPVQPAGRRPSPSLAVGAIVARRRTAGSATPAVGAARRRPGADRAHSPPAAALGLPAIAAVAGSRRSARGHARRRPAIGRAEAFARPGPADRVRRVALRLACLGDGDMTSARRITPGRRIAPRRWTATNRTTFATGFATVVSAYTLVEPRFDGSYSVSPGTRSTRSWPRRRPARSPAGAARELGRTERSSSTPGPPACAGSGPDERSTTTERIGTVPAVADADDQLRLPRARGRDDRDDPRWAIAQTVAERQRRVRRRADHRTAWPRRSGRPRHDRDHA